MRILLAVVVLLSGLVVTVVAVGVVAQAGVPGDLTLAAAPMAGCCALHREPDASSGLPMRAMTAGSGRTVYVLDGEAPRLLGDRDRPPVGRSHVAG